MSRSGRLLPDDVRQVPLHLDFDPAFRVGALHHHPLDQLAQRLPRAVVGSRRSLGQRGLEADDRVEVDLDGAGMELHPDRRPAGGVELRLDRVPLSAELGDRDGRLRRRDEPTHIALVGAMAPLDGMAEPIFDRIAPGDLLVDESYQPGLSARSLRLIRSIVAGWDWLKFKPPVVAITDRGFEVIDGQHTAIAAACHPGISTIPILALDGSDHARRACAFVSHAVDRLKATPAQVWHAKVAAGDEDAMTVRNVLDRARVRLLPYPPIDGVYGVNDTVALGAVRHLVDKRGAMRAREVLDLVAGAELSPVTADHIRVAEALFLDPEYVGGLEPARITAALRGITPKQSAEAKEFAFAKRTPVWRALAAMLYRAHATPKRGRAKVAEAA